MSARWEAHAFPGDAQDRTGKKAVLPEGGRRRTPGLTAIQRPTDDCRGRGPVNCPRSRACGTADGQVRAWDWHTLGHTRTEGVALGRPLAVSLQELGEPGTEHSRRSPRDQEPRQQSGQRAEETPTHRNYSNEPNWVWVVREG